jgi:hypothetical protein
MLGHARDVRVRKENLVRRYLGVNAEGQELLVDWVAGYEQEGVHGAGG